MLSVEICMHKIVRNSTDCTPSESKHLTLNQICEICISDSSQSEAHKSREALSIFSDASFVIVCLLVYNRRWRVSYKLNSEARDQAEYHIFR